MGWLRTLPKEAKTAEQRHLDGANAELGVAMAVALNSLGAKQLKRQGRPKRANPDQAKAIAAGRPERPTRRSQDLAVSYRVDFRSQYCGGSFGGPGRFSRLQS
jgi:hypothetical protein